MRKLSSSEMMLIFGGGSDTDALEPVPVPDPPPEPPPDTPTLPPVVVEGPSTPSPGPQPSPPPPPPEGGNEPGGGGSGPTPPPPPPCYQQQATNADRVSYNYVRNHEGGVLTRGYVPGNASGVTIGSGVDLAFRLASELQGWGVPSSVVTQLSPYLATGPGAFGPRGSAAQAALTANGGLDITSTAALQLTTAMESSVRNSLVNSFNSSNTMGASFDRLPMEFQTVAFDTAYHLGMTGLRSGSGSAFYNALLAGNFSGAASELTRLQTLDRRYSDNAALANSAISNNSVPPNAGTVCT